MDAAELGLDPATVWGFEVVGGVTRWLSKDGRPTVDGETVRPVIVDDEDVVYQHEVRG
jgi:hypothetical protein